MNLLNFFRKIKEMVVSGATSGILYNLFPKEIIILQGIDSYIAWRIQKYGWKSSTYQTVQMVHGDNRSSSQSCWNIFPPWDGLEGHQFMGSDTYSRKFSYLAPNSQYRVSRSHPSSPPTQSGSHRVMNSAWCSLSTTTLESSSWFHRSLEQSINRLAR